MPKRNIGKDSVKGKPAKYIVLNTLKIFLPVILIILVLTLIFLANMNKIERQGFINVERSLCEVALKNINEELDHAIHDLFMLKANSNVNKFLEHSASKEAREQLSKYMFDLAYYHQSYDQVRFIDENGMEVIRVNFNNGQPAIVPAAMLQDKSQRYYFKESIVLDENEVFISPLDLNVENGEIERPLKPMIRIATPVFDKQGKKQGIILFNYLAEQILTKLEEYSNLIQGTQMVLLNAEGYCLKGLSSEFEWGFMYKDKKDVSFVNRFPEAWKKISTTESAQFVNPVGLFSSTTIYPLAEVHKYRQEAGYHVSDEKQKYYWKLVSFVPDAVLYAKSNSRWKLVSLIFILFSVSIFYVTWRLARSQYYRKQALKSLKASNDTKDKLFSIIAHDLRSPFNSLLGFSDLLEEEVENETNTRLKDYVSIIKSTLLKTYDFISNLLEWSRVQTDRITFNPEPFNLFELVEEISELFKLQVSKKGIRVYNLADKELTVNADKNILHTVFRNLISNAIKYCNTDGEIKVEAFVSQSVLHCSVSDNGIGMDNETLQKLMNTDAVKSTLGTGSEKGNGLGISLCKDLIKKHGGKLGVDSELGKGSVFWFEIGQ